MKYTINDIKNMIADASAVETYSYMYTNGNIHTDNIEYIGNSNFDMSEVDALQYDGNGEIDVDIRIMDEEEYDSTICANSCEKFRNSYYDNDTVAVIVIRK